MLTNLPAYHTARALFPQGFDPRELGFLYEPLPVPADHPELDLFGIGRVQEANAAADLEEAGSRNEVGEDGTVADAAGLARTSPEGRRGGPVLLTEEEPLRARMLNEFVYCPRLFYYEQVEGVFVHNADTERGAAIHEKVDRGKGALPRVRKKRTAAAAAEAAPDAGAEGADASMAAEGAMEMAGTDFTEAGQPDLSDLKTHEPEANADAEAAGETIHSRSAMMSSERLRVVAKMDLIEVKMSGGGRAGSGRMSAAAAAMPDLFATREVQSVTPVDYKAGAPRLADDRNELWDADKMQLGLQILILRDNGYVCDEGVIYYRATKQRVPLRMTAEVEAWIIDRIAEARRVAAAPTIPPPLVNSPKCVRCSLAPVCLPDETRLLVGTRPSGVNTNTCISRTGTGGGAGAATALANANTVAAGRAKVAPAGGPRRLIAARDDERALYLNTPGCRVGLRSERLIIKDGECVVDEVRLLDVTHVALFGNIQISTQALHELCEQEIPVAYFSMGGWFYGLTRGHGLKNVHTRIRQFAVAGNPLQCLAVAQKMVQAKIRNHRTMMMRLHVEAKEAALVNLKEIAARVPNARGLDELLGMEGAAAAVYFQHFAGMIKVGEEDLEDEIPGLAPSDAGVKRRQEEAEAFTFDFTQRRRRPPTDPVNALLSLAYSLLAKDCTIAALAVGFDPYIGFYHQPRHGRPALALDLMEEFRPLVAESAVLTAINNRMVTPGHFVRAGDAVNLTPQGRRAFFYAYEQRMNTLITHPVFDYKVSYRRVMELQARLLARWLTGEIPDYVPMVTR